MQTSDISTNSRSRILLTTLDSSVAAVLNGPCRVRTAGTNKFPSVVVPAAGWVWPAEAEAAAANISRPLVIPGEGVNNGSVGRTCGIELQAWWDLGLQIR